MKLEVIILAAGGGTRMHSDIPKALHIIGGAPMLQHSLATAHALNPNKIHIVIGGEKTQGDLVKTMLLDIYENNPPSALPKLSALNWVTQIEQLGSGHAAQQALPHVQRDALLLFLYADTPLITPVTLKKLLTTTAEKSSAARIGLLTTKFSSARECAGLGRILRASNASEMGNNDKAGKVLSIVEEKDATRAQLQIRECNTGVVAAPAPLMQAALGKLTKKNAQGEFYLTDTIAHAVAAGAEVADCQTQDAREAIGVNTSADLARAERVFQARQAQRLFAQGVRLRDPARLEVRGECQFGRDCEVDVNVILEGKVVVGAGCKIGAGVIIRDSNIGDGCIIEPNCVIERAQLGARCVVGPFARLRPNAQLAAQARIGNFVEIKQSRIGAASKISHLSYVGDSELGEGVNIGAGVITCNYDGAKKHRTQIGARAFIGSNSQLVAPLTIGEGATIGAGSTITKNVGAQSLAVTRAAQKELKNWGKATADAPVAQTRARKK